MPRYLIEQYDNKGKRIALQIRTEADPDEFIDYVNDNPDDFRLTYEIKITRLVDTTTYLKAQPLFRRYS